MKNIKRQEKSGQCGVYNLANLLQDDSILKYAKDKKYIPCGITEVNQILRKEGYDDFLLSPVIAAVVYTTKIPTDFASYLMLSYPSNSSIPECFYPFVVYVQGGKDEYGLHAISILVSIDKVLYSDPLNAEFIEVDSINDVFSKYKYVNSIYGLANSDGDYVGFEKEYVN